MVSARSGRTALVQGASRGLGLEFVRQILRESPASRVVATCRNPAAAEELHRLQAQVSAERLHVARLDVQEPESIAAAAEAVAEFTEELDLLLNVAALLHIPGKMRPETSIARVKYEDLLASFQTNAIGPILVSQAFLPLLRQSRAETPLIANLSARVSSIGDNGIGGWYSYRSSKSALNQLTKTLSIELARKKPAVACVLLHPGTCETDLSAPFRGNVPPGKLFSRELAVSQLLGVLNGVTQADTGKFFAWDGSQIEW